MDSLNDLINKRIEAMRPKLMDMTRRNPLLKNVFSPSSASFISIVDENPQNLLDDICADKKMYLAPLPPRRVTDK